LNNRHTDKTATKAADADDLLVMIRLTVESNSRAKQAATQSKQYHELYLADKKLSATPKPEHAEKTATKAAELFNTNRTYVNQAGGSEAYATAMLETLEPLGPVARMASASFFVSRET